MEIQARIPPALAAVHNFIRKYDPDELTDFVDLLDDFPDMEDFGELGTGPASRQERNRATADRDSIAEEMWADYQAYIAEHNM